MFALPTAIYSYGHDLSNFVKINKPQLLCENVYFKCKILPIFEKKFI